MKRNCRHCLRHQPLNPNAHGILGGILLADPQRLSEATDELRTAVKLQPDLPDALSNLGVALDSSRPAAGALEPLPPR